MDAKCTKDYHFSVCTRKEIKDFIEENHYSHNINGLDSKYCFKLEFDGLLIGAIIFVKLSMANVWKKYAETELEILELKRLVCVDDTLKNTESYFIGKSLKWLSDHAYIGLRTIISYADSTYGHSGVVYKASNFKLVGKTSPGRVIWCEGKRYHDKTIRTTYKGVVKPFAALLKAKLESGDAEYRTTGSKNIYIYTLRRRRRTN